MTHTYKKLKTGNDFKAKLEKGKHDFKTILKDPRVIRTGLNNNEPRDLNIVLGVHRRPAHLRAVIEGFLKNKGCLQNARIIIVEFDTSPTIDPESLRTIWPTIEYTFIPIDLIQTDNLFSRALAFNVAYLISEKTDYYLFHDCDVLVPPKFLETLRDRYISKNITWVQPFSKKRLFMLNENTTNCIFTNSSLPPKSERGEWASSGAAGGSTLVRRDVFESIGGFDSEIFYGYAPEDSIFLTKLCCLERELDKIDTCHNASAEHYADDPPIDLYHLYHENLLFQSYELHKDLRSVLYDFWELPYKEKLNYINEKREMLKEYAKTL